MRERLKLYEDLAPGLHNLSVNSDEVTRAGFRHVSAELLAAISSPGESMNI